MSDNTQIAESQGENRTLKLLNDIRVKVTRN